MVFYACVFLCVLWAGAILGFGIMYPIDTVTMLSTLVAGIFSAVVLFKGILNPMGDEWICEACLRGECSACEGENNKGYPCMCIANDQELEIHAIDTRRT